MATARIYRDGDGPIAFLPAVLEEGTFYLVDDPEQLADTVLGELRLLQRHWRGDGHPLLVIPVAAGPFQRDPAAVIRLGLALASGELEGVPVRLDRLDALAEEACWVALPAPASVPAAEPNTTGPVLLSSTCQHPLTLQQEKELEEIPMADLAERLWGSTSLSEQAELLDQLVRRLGQNAILQGPSCGGPVTLLALVEEVYRRSLAESNWSVVRRCAGLMQLVHPQLEDALTDLLVLQKQLVVGRNYTRDSLITQPQGSGAIGAMIQRFSGEDGREWMVQQELLLALDGLARQEPALLRGSLTLQLGQLLLLLTGELAAERDLTPDDAFEALCSLPPRDPPSPAGRARRCGPRPGGPAAQGAAPHQRPGALGCARPARRPAGGESLLAAAPPAAWGAAEGSQGFLCRHLGPAAPLPRPGDRRQAGTSQPPGERTVDLGEDPR